MSKSYNGIRTNTIDVDDNNTKQFKIQEDSVDSDGNVYSSETDFRGFEKMPVVLCERLDITPYLIKMGYPLAPDITAKKKSKDTANESITNKLLLACSVVLVREDLEKLKVMVKNNTLPNYNRLKCVISDKIKYNAKKLQNHQQNKHMIVYNAQNKTPKRVSFSDQIIVHEVKEHYRCRKCPRIFENFNSLRIHMKQKHRKPNCYICDYCSKQYVDRKFFKVHIKLHCDSCGLLLANKKKYQDHRRYACRIKKKHNCKICNLTFFNYMDLKDHSYDHLSTFFICDICKDQFQTKCEVIHHITFLHTNNHSNELYSKQIDGHFECNFCEETTEQEHGIEQHLSILPDLQNHVTTGYKDFNFCDVCLKKFSTEKDMLEHKWTHFRTTSDNSQLRNRKTNTNNSTSNTDTVKTRYNVNDKLPDFLQPKLVLEKIILPQPQKEQARQNDEVIHLDHSNFKGTLKKAVVDPITKKTIISKHRCEKCGKYLSSNYCLTRHLHFVHGVVKESNCMKNLQCTKCEEIFVWPSLLQSHNCIRMSLPELPFDDARPEVHFDNPNEMNQDAMNDFGVMDDDDYMNAVDYEIPAPIVQLTEFENLKIVISGGNGTLNAINNKTYSLNELGYKVVMQEVPIEF